VEYFFANRDEASRRAADFIADRLREGIEAADRAAVVVSGGTSPVKCFDYLSSSKLPWESVQVLLSDERWVAPDNEASNEKLVRQCLLKGPASKAGLLGVYAADSTPGERCTELDLAMRDVAMPFACTLLGMGSDGHFASLFPDASNLAAGLDPRGAAAFLPIRTAASPHPRISMTLSALLDSRAILLLIFGQEKREVYEAAAAGSEQFPVSALLRQDQAPVHVFWAE
jgi:6-phosphogluconolactonase